MVSAHRVRYAAMGMRGSIERSHKPYTEQVGGAELEAELDGMAVGYA